MAKKKGTALKKNVFFEKYKFDIILIVLIFLSVFVFLHEALLGYGFNSSDAISFRSFDKFQDLAKDRGNFPLWIPYIFSGMPAVMVSYGDRVWDIIARFYFSISHFFMMLFDGNRAAILATHYGVYGIGMYLLMRSKKFDKFVSFFTAFAAVFSTAVIIWMMIGHNSKIVAFSMFPFIFMFIESIREKFTLLKFTGLVIVLHIMFASNHIQIIFYSGIAYFFYFLFEIFGRLAKKEKINSVLISMGSLAIAGILAFGMYADRYMSILEYTPYSTRGKGALVEGADSKQSKDGGNSYEYATGWSFSPKEVVTFFVPNYYGFGKLDYSGPATGNRETKIMTYWGNKPFEDVAPYMGIAVLIFAFAGIILYRRNVFVQFLAVMSFFALLLSFGHNWSPVFDLFYYNVPLFNKFRVPSMVLLLIQFAVPILAGYGLKGLMELRQSKNKNSGNKIIYVLLAVSGLFLLLGFIFSAVMETSYIQSYASSRTGSQYPAQIHNFVWESMITDWYQTAGILIVSVVLVFLYVKKKINYIAFASLLALFLIVDMWRVAYRPMEVAEKPMNDAVFRQNDVVEFIKQDKSIYRIADFATQSQNIPAHYLLQNVGGYSAAKLRIYQDMLDVADDGSTSYVTNPFLWNLLNVKYIITSQPMQAGLRPAYQSQTTGHVVYMNQGMMPRTFFVDSIAVKDGLSILQMMKEGNFNPYRVGFVEEALPQNIEAPDSTAYSEMVEFDNEYIKIKSKASGNNFLFISEIYYPAGWKAYIDGKETEIFKTNYVFRGIIVPEGEHTIELKFKSEAFATGKTISIAGNIIVFLLLIAGFVLQNRRKKTEITHEKKDE
jgi:hypothetical protein